MTTKVIFRYPNPSEDVNSSTFQYLEGETEYLTDELIQNPNPYFIIRPFERQDFPLAMEAKSVITLSAEQLKKLPFDLPKSGEEIYCATSNQYQTLVYDSLEVINSGKAQKIVPSRVQKWAHGLNNSTSIINYFVSLADIFPNAFVYLIISSELGCWMGASPELLLSADNQQLSTVSLAGTRTQNQFAESNFFADKESNEQTIVTDYIQEVLSQYAIDIEKHTPSIFHHNNLIHLRTIIEGKWKPSVNYHATYLALAEDLHPTPAICGYPKDVSLGFIQQKEGYHRGLYAGYLGLFDKKSVGKLFVNLRCMKLNTQFAYTFAGAGIVDGSDALLEFIETERKMEAILSVNPALFLKVPNV
jgi:isochorismate synthase